MAALTRAQRETLREFGYPSWRPAPTLTMRQLRHLDALLSAGVVEKKFADWTETRGLFTGEIRIKLRACWHYRRVC